MLISDLINKLTLMLKDFGNHPIEIRCDKDRQKITAAMWQDYDDKEPYIKAVTMPEKNN